MHKDLKIYGTATVGTKGQIVIPAEAREGFDMKPGEKIIMIGSCERKFLGIMKEADFGDFLDKLNEHISMSDHEKLSHK